MFRRSLSIISSQIRVSALLYCIIVIKRFSRLIPWTLDCDQGEIRFDETVISLPLLEAKGFRIRG